MYSARWIGYEEGHEEYDVEDDECGAVHWIPRWVQDFYIHIDTKAFRIGNRAGGVNLFWNSIVHPKRFRVFWSCLPDAYRILKARLKGDYDSVH